MSDLFDQLKSAGPLNKSHASPAKSVSLHKSNYTKNVEQLINKHDSKLGSARRESLPSPLTVSSFLKKAKPQKSRSLSPQKYDVNHVIKSLKVKLERKKFEEFLTRPLEEHANNIRKKQETFKDAKKMHPPQVTPTKAQQKLFEPLLSPKQSRHQLHKQFNIKPCKVRIHRDNLQKLAKDFKNKSSTKKDGKSKNNKRPASSTSTESSPPSKKGKLSAGDKNKSRNSFFIKLNTSPTSKLEKKLKNLSKGSPSSEALHNKIKNSKFNTITAPTKFSRSELFRSFGKRFFNVHVKIERCTHPLMLTFESNDRARRLQAKRNKSKNLSVSFSEQVEIFGGSSDSDDSCDENFCAIPSNRNIRKSNTNNTLPVPVTPVIMPARLKKIENGKVVDDIVLDPSLFVDPKVLGSSTPFSPGRKKREHKSFSPLKDESSPSPSKEKLKMANERVSLSGLRRLNIEEDDDEDDECEYIVPIELPQRRTSRTSSNATLDDLTTADLPLIDSPINFPEIFDNDGITDKINAITNPSNAEPDNLKKNDTEKRNAGAIIPAINLENVSNDSFHSATDNFDKNNVINAQANQLPPLLISQSSEFDLETGTGNKPNENEKSQQANGNLCNEASGQHLNTLNTMDDISMNLFLEDSQTNEDDTHAKSFVDSLINDTIDKLSKDIDEDASDKHFTDTT